jgi:hypothetical protein
LPTNALGGPVYGSRQRFVNVHGSVARIPDSSSAPADGALMDEPRRLPLPHTSRSTSCSQTAPLEPATSARCWDVVKHKPLPTRGVTTAVRSAHQARPLRPACCSWKGAGGQPAFPANRRNRRWAPTPRRRKHRCRPSAKKIAVRKTGDASWAVPLAFRVLLAGILVENTGCSIRTQSPRNELPSNMLNNMKGRALSFEKNMNFCSTDPAMTIASAFKRSASSHSAAPASCTSPPNAQLNGTAAN